MKDRIQSTAYLVAHVHTDPNGKMLPQVHAVCIYSESATSLSAIGRDSAALDVYRVRGVDYQSARDLLCHSVQTFDHFAWCRPLMDPKDMEPIDYLYLEFASLNTAKVDALCEVLCNALMCSEEDARRYIKEGSGPLVRAGAVGEINGAQRAARAWLKRDFDAQKEAA
jgi:hypothetical protein